MTEISVESIYGHTTKQPLVNVILPDGRDRVSLRVTEARDLAANLLAAAEAALGDGFIYEFALGDGDPRAEETQRMAAGLMRAFRNFRAKYDPEEEYVVDGQDRPRAEQ